MKELAVAFAISVTLCALSWPTQAGFIWETRDSVPPQVIFRPNR